MIILVKNQNRKRLIVKTLSFVSLFIMFFLYYNHMSAKFQEQNIELTSKLDKKEKQEKKLNSKTVKYENLIFNEAKTITTLLQQKHIQSIKIVKDKLLIVCDYSTNIEPLLVRYGANALIKNSDTNIKIAIDLAMIVESKYEA